MQASRSQWVAPTGVLGRILAETTDRVSALRSRSPDLAARASAAPPAPAFAESLRRDGIAVIAEIKRRSPSKGVINLAIDPAHQARAFATGGAAAISVLTEPVHFGGDLDDIGRARSAAGLPVLRKDFIIHPLQLAEARAAGASAALLIVRALPPTVLSELMAAARDHGLETLVEVRSEDELERALEIGAAVIGVNARDLETLEIDSAVTARILPLIPADRIAVAESGVSSAAGAAEHAELGADAILVGTALSASADPATLVAQLAAIPRIGRATRH